MDRQELRQAYLKTQETLTDLATQVDQVYMPLFKDALGRGDMIEVERLIKECPDHVVQCFMMDQQREAKKAEYVVWLEPSGRSFPWFTYHLPSCSEVKGLTDVVPYKSARDGWRKACPRCLKNLG